MLNIPRYIQAIIIMLVFALIAASLIYVWFPEYISKDTFAKILLSFGIVLAGSVLLSLLRKAMPPATDEKSKKAN